MLLEIRTLAERAETSRAILLELVRAMPEDYWHRRSPGEAWTARHHLEHTGTIDGAVATDVARVRSDGEAWIGGTSDPAAFAASRAGALDELRDAAVDEILDAMESRRAEMLAALERVEPKHLDGRLLVPGVVDRWLRPVSVSLREYLASWAQHDREHAAAIRAAVTAAPDMSIAALTIRKRR